MSRHKRWVIGLISVLAFIGYFIVTDPSNKILSDLGWGVGLIITLQIVAVGLIGMFVVEILGDWYIDPVFGKEKELINKAKEDPKAASIASLSKSLRIVSYAVIIAAAILAFTRT